MVALAEEGRLEVHVYQLNEEGPAEEYDEQVSTKENDYISTGNRLGSTSIYRKTHQALCNGSCLVVSLIHPKKKLPQNSSSPILFLQRRISSPVGKLSL